MIASRQHQTGSHPIYTTELCQAILPSGCFFLVTFVYLYPQEPWIVT